MNSQIATTKEIDRTGSFTSVVLDKISSICYGKNNLMVSIYDTKKNRFIYCSESFMNNLGYSCEDLCEGGWSYWFEIIDPLQAFEIKETVNRFINSPKTLRKQKPIFLSYHVKKVSGGLLKLHHEIRPYMYKEELILFNFLYDTTQHELIEALFGIQKSDTIFNGFYRDVHISQRENEVLVLLAEGLSSKQIASQLFISTQTVLTHRKHLLEKFNVRNTAQLINKAALLRTLGVYYEL